MIQNQISFILLPVFFKEYLNPQVKNNKMGNEYSVNYTLFYFLRTLVLFSLQTCCWNLRQTCISHHACGIFSNLNMQNSGKGILRLKKLKVDIFTHIPQSNILLKSLIITTLTEENYLFPLPKQLVLKNLSSFPQQKEREGEETTKVL